MIKLVKFINAPLGHCLKLGPWSIGKFSTSCWLSSQGFSQIIDREWKLQDSTRFHQILPDPIRFHQILSDTTRFYQIPPDSNRFHQIHGMWKLPEAQKKAMSSSESRILNMSKLCVQPIKSQHRILYLHFSLQTPREGEGKRISHEIVINYCFLECVWVFVGGRGNGVKTSGK